MKPFDLEAAKRGEPIFNERGKIRLFVGVDSAGYVVVEDLMGALIRYSADSLFMAPKKRTVWVNFFEPSMACFFYASEDLADAGYESCKRIGGKAYPVEIEE